MFANRLMTPPSFPQNLLVSSIHTLIACTSLQYQVLFMRISGPQLHTWLFSLPNTTFSNQLEFEKVTIRTLHDFNFKKRKFYIYIFSMLLSDLFERGLFFLFYQLISSRRILIMSHARQSLAVS